MSGLSLRGGALCLAETAQGKPQPCMWEKLELRH